MDYITDIDNLRIIRIIHYIYTIIAGYRPIEETKYKSIQSFPIISNENQ